jgi:Ca2+-binding EF-hand superfamily protein
VGLVLVFAGLMLGKGMFGPSAALAEARAVSDELASPMALTSLPEPPQASELSREQKRFNRYDRDKNGRVDRVEYLNSRQKAFARLDLNGDGRLDFEEYAVKAAAKFKAADKDANGALSGPEFSTTRVVRKAKPKCVCAPASKPAPEAADEDESGA